jgi:hypothetical protein
MTVVRKQNRGQFTEGSKRAVQMGRLGGQISAKNRGHRAKSNSRPHAVIRGDANDDE